MATLAPSTPLRAVPASNSARRGGGGDGAGDGAPGADGGGGGRHGGDSAGDSDARSDAGGGRGCGAGSRLGHDTLAAGGVRLAGGEGGSRQNNSLMVRPATTDPSRGSALV